jgi:hypothetical protein
VIPVCGCGWSSDNKIDNGDKRTIDERASDQAIAGPKTKPSPPGSKPTDSSPDKISELPKIDQAPPVQPEQPSPVPVMPTVADLSSIDRLNPKFDKDILPFMKQVCSQCHFTFTVESSFKEMLPSIQASFKGFCIIKSSAGRRFKVNIPPEKCNVEQIKTYNYVDSMGVKLVIVETSLRTMPPGDEYWGVPISQIPEYKKALGDVVNNFKP